MTNQNNTPWTPERTARLRELRALQHSFGVIAADLGITRSQVAGKCKREGLVGKSTVTLAPVARVRAPKPAPIDMLNIGIAELRRNTCRFMATATYCGLDTGGGSYCDYHRTIVYRPERRIERRTERRAATIIGVLDCGTRVGSLR